MPITRADILIDPLDIDVYCSMMCRNVLDTTLSNIAEKILTTDKCQNNNFLCCNLCYSIRGGLVLTFATKCDKFSTPY